MLHLVLFTGAGWLVGCFTPAICKKVKSWFSSEAETVASDVWKKL